MAKHREFLDLGLWTAPDPAMLEPGQLAAMKNCTYFPGTRALSRAEGRAVFGTVTASAVDVNGLRDIQFDNGDQLLVAMTSGVYSTAYVSGAGAFATLVTGLPSGTQLEAVHFRNRFYLFNGASAGADATGTNRVVYLSATAANMPPTVRNHGMLPVNSFPTVTTANSAASSFSQTVTGYYEYWTTEVAKFQQDGVENVLESTFVGSPKTVFVGTTSAIPTIEEPMVRNPTMTTHWRVYRSPKKDREGDRKFPTGFMISEAATSTTSVADTQTVLNTGFKLPSAENGGSFYADFASASSMRTDNGVYASAVVGALPLRPVGQGVNGYNFGNFAGTIKGIEVELQGYVQAGTAPAPVKVTIGKRLSNGDFDRGVLGVGVGAGVIPIAAAMGTITSTNSASPTTITLGGSNQRWTLDSQPGFVDSDFTGQFMTVIEVSKAGVTVGFDYIQVKVYYAATVDSTVVFPTVVYSFGDVIAQVGKNGQPPSSSTGDMFEDCLVVNDVTNQSLIRYSFPGETESFPETYFIDFETRENDRVRLVKVVNNRLIVGLDSSLWRINYLPSERDASFDRGKAKEAISRSYGIVNPMCACVFSIDGATEILAGVSNQGIFGTDGYGVTFYTDGLNWRGIIPTSGGTPIALVNDPENQRLIFLYRNDSNGNETFLALHLSYASEHLIDGKPKVSGPIHMRNFVSGSSSRANPASIWVAPRSNGDRTVYIGYGSDTAAGGGQVWTETGTTIPAEDSTMSYTTRRMYLADFGGEWRLNNLWGHVGSANNQPTASYAMFLNKTNDNGPSAGPSKSIVLTGQKLHKVPFALMTEGLSIQATITASAYAQEFLILDGDDFGEEDAGRT